jgi:molybdopterin/thiamine biosynthesis adenylyltransferase/rhodanese-related sulfurtransferase
VVDRKMLTDKEIAYYSRQLLVDEIGIAGQLKLKQAKVLVVGAGGLGCPLLQYITAAGVGSIGIVDGDFVDISNLHRQILYDFNSIGKNKAVESKNKLTALNPYSEIDVFPYALETENALRLIQKYDIIVDCSDNYATRFLVNDACVLLQKIVVYGSIYRFEGQVSVFNFQNGPTYRCLFPELPTEESTTNCSLSGVIGVLPGIIGVLQANEVIKIITGIGDVLSGKLLVYNALKNTTDFFLINKNQEFDYESLFIDNQLEKENYIKSCSISVVNEINHQQVLDESDQYILLDVREVGELPIFEGENILKIPLGELKNHVNVIPKTKNIVVFCKSGNRSKKAIEILQNDFEYDNVINLINGISTQFIEEWERKTKC